MPGGGYALPGLQNIPLTPALSPKGRGRKDGSVQSSLSKAAREKRRLRAVLSLRSGEGEKTAPCSLLSPKRQGRKTAPCSPLSPKRPGRKDGSVQSSLSEAAREKRRLRAVTSLRSGKGEKTAPCSPLSPKRRGRKDGSVQSSLSKRAREKKMPPHRPFSPKWPERKRRLRTVPSPLWGEG